jgi:hypothetical protein
VVSSKGYAGVPLDLCAPKEGRERPIEAGIEAGTHFRLTGQVEIAVGDRAATIFEAASEGEEARTLIAVGSRGLGSSLTPEARKRLDEGLEGGKGHIPIYPREAV